MTMVTILPVSSYEIGKEYTPNCDIREYRYFIPIILWRETPIVTRMWYSDGYELIEASRTTAEDDIAVIRSVKFKINIATGTIEVESYNQTNLQSTATWYLKPNTVDGLGLVGIKS